jgi:small multidrug resistance pump
VALDKIDLGIAYAVWSALGTTVLTGVGIAFFGEKYGPTKLACLALVVVGVVGLNLG